MKQFLLALTLAIPLFVSAQEQQYFEPPKTVTPPQNWCGSGTDFAGGVQSLDAWAQDYYVLGKRATVNTKKYLPMCLHLLGNTDGTLQMRPSLALDLICDLNDDYRPHNIQYWLDSIDTKILNSTWNDPPTGNSSWGSTMPTGTRRAANRVNLYFHGGGSTTGLCGRYTGSAVGSGTNGSPDVVNCFGGCLTRNNTTVTHEMGHYNAMPHTFYGLEGTGNFASGATCGTQKTGTLAEKHARTGGNCSSAGDRFCDTYPDYNSDRWNCDGNGESCSIISPDGVTFKINGRNYMSYADDACADHPFTQNQEDRMHTYIQSQRASMLTVARVGDTITTQTTLAFPRADSSNCFGVTDLSTIGINLSWDATPNAKYYILQISKLPTMSSAIIEDVIVSDTSYNTKKLLVNTNYYWRVRPYNKVYFCTSGSQTSAIRKFNTKCLNTTDNIKGLSAATIIPNPVSDERFSVSVEATEAFTTNINIINMNGQVVRELGKQRIEQGETNLDFTVNDIPNGFYMVQMQTETGVKTLRMVIAR